MKCRHYTVKVFGLAVIMTLGIFSILGTGGGGNLFEIDPFTVAVNTDIVARDLDGDGFNDLAVTAEYIATPATKSGYVFVFFQDNSAPGNFLPPMEFSVGDYPWGMEIADLNGDSLPDIVTANVDAETISILFHDQANVGSFLPAVHYAGGQRPYAVSIGHLNGDGLFDIAIANSHTDESVSIVFQDLDSPGDFLPAINLPYEGGASSIAVKDLNNDGFMDIATEDLIFMQDNLNPGEFLTPIPINYGGWNIRVEAHDLNDDLLNDLVISNHGLRDGRNAGVLVLINDPDLPGNFLEPVKYSTANDPYKIVVEDFNKDNLPDLAVGSNTYPIGVVSVLFQSSPSHGTFSSAVEYKGGRGDSRFLSAGDLNADGNIDIAVSKDGGPGIYFQDEASPGEFLPITFWGNFY